MSEARALPHNDLAGERLGFGQLRQLLHSLTLCPLGDERVEELRFSTDGDRIRRQLVQTAEMKRLLAEADFPTEGFVDARPVLHKLRLEGSYAEPLELLAVRKSLAAVGNVISCLTAREDPPQQKNHFTTLSLYHLSDTGGAVREGLASEGVSYPELAKLCEGITSLPVLIRQIDKIIDETGAVRDNASPTLARIRRELQGERGRMNAVMQRVLQHAKSEGIVEADATPTLREGRMVIPVPADKKKRLSGILHDMSDTGRTAFIEPASVVEASARICSLENEEHREIIALLRLTASTIRPYLADALRSYDFLAEIDFIHAKARLAQRLQGELPAEVVDSPLIDWSQATHPLLRLALENRDAASAEDPSSDYAERERTRRSQSRDAASAEDPSSDYAERELPSTGNRTVVPLDIQLHDPDQRMLLISGPNAGGKSVCLKTVGLLQYILQCGLLPPLSPASRCGLFTKIFINIGDEQDLSDDLSTYSAHLLAMKTMLRQGDSRSLLLIDEFGSGTEPRMGAALAEAMLHQFLANGCWGIITTHYHNLKLAAEEGMGIRNAAMLYDRAAMRPLFQLQIGNPGSSFAIEIAHKIGLPQEVIAEAKEIAGSDLVNFDKYLQDINRDKRYWQSKRTEIHQQEKTLEKSRLQYEETLSTLRTERKQILDQAKREAQQLVDDAKARIERTIKEIKEAQAERERTKEVRAELDQWLAGQQAREEEDKRLQAQAEKVKRRQERRKTKKSQPKPSTPDLTASAAPAAETLPLTIGANVKFVGQSTVGRIVKISGKEAQVAFGSVIINAPLHQLTPAQPPKNDKRTYTLLGRITQEQLHQTKLNFSSEINLLGLRVDEALEAVMHFLDDAQVSGSHHLRILHGTGTGALKTAIRQYLSAQPSVRSFHDDHPQQGGAGVTIVEL